MPELIALKALATIYALTIAVVAAATLALAWHDRQLDARPRRWLTAGAAVVVLVAVIAGCTAVEVW